MVGKHNITKQQMLIYIYKWNVIDTSHISGCDFDRSINRIAEQLQLLVHILPKHALALALKTFKA